MSGLKTAVIFALSALACMGQTGGLSIVNGVIDFHGAAHTASVSVVANVGSLPSSGCTVGELAIVTSAPLGQQIFQNSSAGCLWTQQVTSSISPGYPANQQLSGCGIEYVSGLTFTVGQCTYTINGNTYTSPQANVTLMAADATNPRIDSIIVDITSTASVLTGVAATPALAPNTDPSTQLELTEITVNALATTPTGIVSTLLYDEGTGSGGGEWTAAVTANLNATSTNNPYSLTHDVEASAAVLGNDLTLTKPSSGTVDLATVNNVVFYIRSKAQWPTGASGGNAARSLAIFWKNGSAVKGATVMLRDGAFGFISSNTSSYQQVSIPAGLFGINGVLVTTLEIQVAGPTGTSSIGFYIDKVTLQSGFGTFTLPNTLMNFRGTWNSSTAYRPNDTVVSGGVGYVALAANTNVAVSTTSTWAILATVTGGACTNQAVTAVSSSGVPTCTTITSAYVNSSIAPTASPTFTGVPAAPTAAASTNTTQLATTQFVTTAIGNSGGGTTLCKSVGDPAVDVTNTTTKTAILNCSISANTMGANGILRFIITGDVLSDGTAFTLEMDFGGMSFISGSINNGNSANKNALEITGDITNAAATNIQYMQINYSQNAGVAAGSLGSNATGLNFRGYNAGAIDTTSTQSLTVYVTWVAAHMACDFRAFSAAVALTP